MDWIKVLLIETWCNEPSLRKERNEWFCILFSDLYISWDGCHISWDGCRLEKQALILWSAFTTEFPDLRNSSSQKPWFHNITAKPILRYNFVLVINSYNRQERDKWAGRCSSSKLPPHQFVIAARNMSNIWQQNCCWWAHKNNKCWPNKHSFDQAKLKRIWYHKDLAIKDWRYFLAQKKVSNPRRED